MDFQWLQEVERLKEKAGEFITAFSRLQQLESVAKTNDAAYIKYNNLMTRGVEIKDRISYLTGLIDTVFEWFSGNGSEPPETVASLQGLGLLWVPVTIVAGAVAAIVAWISDAYVNIKELETAKELIAQNVSPSDAYRIAREQEQGVIGGFFQGIRNNFVLFTALGLAAWYITRQTGKRGK